MNKIAWWLRQTALILAGSFFLAFGICILMAAYALKDPHSFIMAFFAANLIILISSTLIVGFVFKMVKGYRRMRDEERGLALE